MTKLTLNKSFTSLVPRSDRVIKIAEAFGIGLEEHEFVVLKEVTLDIEPGQVVYITGQSGSGKSCLLREIAAGLALDGKTVVSIDDVELDETKAVIDQIGKTINEATHLLAVAGISDAYLFIRRPGELSDGQRYRFKLAKLLEAKADVWVADEFGAVLDRVTAKVLSINIAKLARKFGKTLIVATTHTDLSSELSPCREITKQFQERIKIVDLP